MSTTIILLHGHPLSTSEIGSGYAAVTVVTQYVDLFYPNDTPPSLWGKGTFIRLWFAGNGVGTYKVAAATLSQDAEWSRWNNETQEYEQIFTHPSIPITVNGQRGFYVPAKGRYTDWLSVNDFQMGAGSDPALVTIVFNGVQNAPKFLDYAEYPDPSPVSKINAENNIPTSLTDTKTPYGFDRVNNILTYTISVFESFVAEGYYKNCGYESGWGYCNVASLADDSYSSWMSFGIQLQGDPELNHYNEIGFYFACVVNGTEYILDPENISNAIYYGAYNTPKPSWLEAKTRHHWKITATPTLITLHIDDVLLASHNITGNSLKMLTSFSTGSDVYLLNPDDKTMVIDNITIGDLNLFKQTDSIYQSTLTVTTNPSPGDTLTIHGGEDGDIVFTFVDHYPNNSTQIQIGTDVNQTAENIAASLNAITGAEFVATVSNNIITIEAYTSLTFSITATGSGLTLGIVTESYAVLISEEANASDSFTAIEGGKSVQEDASAADVIDGLIDGLSEGATVSDYIDCLFEEIQEGVIVSASADFDGLIDMMGEEND